MLYLVVGAILACVGPVVVIFVDVVVFLVLFIHCLCWALPVSRGAGGGSRQVAAFGVLTSQVPRYLGLLVPHWGLRTPNDPPYPVDGEGGRACIIVVAGT